MTGTGGLDTQRAQRRKGAPPGLPPAETPAPPHGLGGTGSGYSLSPWLLLWPRKRAAHDCFTVGCAAPLLEAGTPLADVALVPPGAGFPSLKNLTPAAAGPGRLRVHRCPRLGSSRIPQGLGQGHEPVTNIRERKAAAHQQGPVRAVSGLSMSMALTKALVPRL